MFGKNKCICTQCETGRTLYTLDSHSYECPYISCYSKGKCSYYKPVKTERKSSFHKLLKVFSKK